ncbi:helix-turn-helix domain-containing protein [Streptomyces virginiae]|uniref:helix-turn-helix domain-containing protein n=1 Tax=Streptomyces virginiae TaxID=1961 RepID=UPI0036E2FD5D
METAEETLCFGDVLQTSRRRVGLTQEQLAGLSTVSVRAIRDLELGRAHRPRGQTVRLLADALQLTGSPRMLLESAAGRPAADGAVRQLFREGAAAPPAPTGPLFGRGAEKRLVREILHRERLVSLVGLAGVGKTRLVQEVALLERAEGPAPAVWIGTSSAAAGREDRSRAVFSSWVRDRLRGAAPAGELAGLLGSGRTLLVLDGYEAGWVRPDCLTHLLDRCAGLRVLVTSREPVAFPGGVTVPLPPLDTTGGPEEATSPVVDLLRAQLRCTRPGLVPTPATDAALAELGRALDGLPLALHLAAAWFPVYSPEQLAPIARQDPLELLEPVFGDGTEPEGGSGGLRKLLRHAVAGLRPAEAAVLRAMAAMAGPVPVAELVRRCGRPLGETTRALHALLQRGLVRQDRTPSGEDALAVLNVVRHAGV